MSRELSDDLLRQAVEAAEEQNAVDIDCIGWNGVVYYPGDELPQDLVEYLDSIKTSQRIVENTRGQMAIKPEDLE